MANIGLAALKNLINLVISPKVSPDKIRPSAHNAVLTNLVDTLYEIVMSAPMSPAQNTAYQQLFSGLPLPIQLSEQDVDVMVPIPVDSIVDEISMEDVSGAPLVKIGTVAGGSDVVESQLIAGYVPVGVGKRCKDATILYVSVSGGKVNIRIDIRPSLFKNVLNPFSDQSTFTKAQIEAFLLLKADKLNVLLLDGATEAERPASEADLASLDFDKADKSNVLLKDGATPDLQPASKADLVANSMIWFGNVESNGTVHKVAGSLTVSCVRSTDGVYVFTHNHNADNYYVVPGLGVGNGLGNPRGYFNKTSTHFTVNVSSDNVRHDCAFELTIHKY